MKGTVVVVLHKDGHLMGSGACTKQGGPAGWSTDDYQAQVAGDEAWSDAIRNACHPDVAVAITAGYSHTLRTIKGALQERCGWREHVRRFQLPDE